VSASSPANPAPVVFVHGIWMTGLELWPLMRRVGRSGFRCARFRYRSLRRPLAVNAAALAGFVARRGEPRVDLVCHSLGGLVALRMLRDHPDVPVGRLVLVGSPVRGSGVAGRLHARPWSRRILGAAAEALVPAVPTAWEPARPVGLIVGNRGLGIGRLVGGLDGPSDGTVAVAETRLPGAADVVELPLSHMGLVLSRRVVPYVVGFLRHGRFPVGAAAVAPEGARGGR
jgi:pimeloyl-ACP methyl ester carboxylesterase